MKVWQFSLLATIAIIFLLFPSFTAADKPGSCNSDGTSYCNQKSSDGCYCDSVCTQYGDCCEDYITTCGSTQYPTTTINYPYPTVTTTIKQYPYPTTTITYPYPSGSCVGYCNTKSQSGCWCDTYCTSAGDCCADYKAVCVSSPYPTTTSYPYPTTTISYPYPTTTIGYPSVGCVGYCGTKSPSGCYCDSVCTNYGDCCANYQTACGSSQYPTTTINYPYPTVTTTIKQYPYPTTTITYPYPSGSCVGYCNTKSQSGCWCDTYCTSAGDCCADYKTTCA